MSEPTAVSLFCGCGGLDLGFHEAGFRIVYAVDADPAAVRCHERGLGAPTFVRDVTSREFARDVARLGPVDVVLGGFPCQGFSKAGPKVASDRRNDLYLAMRDTVATLRPRLFLAENVDGLRQNFAGSYVTRIKADFESVGYRVEHRILDAAAYGVPQHRRRIFFVGLREPCDEHFEWPRPTHAAEARNGEFRIEQDAPLFEPEARGGRLLPALTIRDAIADLQALDADVPDHRVTEGWPDKYGAVFRAIGAGQKLCNVRHSPTSVYTWSIPEVFGRTTKVQRKVLETIARNRRHLKYGTIPNGNPLALDVVSTLTGIPEPALSKDVRKLLESNYLKQKDGKYDLKGAMFCSGLFKRPVWDAPAPTVLTNFHNPRYFLHPEEDRPFSLRECARLQSFPDSFRFTEPDGPLKLVDAYRLVGNAVPPMLAGALARSAHAAVKRTRSTAART